MTGPSVGPGWWSAVKHILDALPQLLLLCDRNGATLHANRATRLWFQRHAGWTELDPAVRSACERLVTLAPSAGGPGGSGAATVQVSSYTTDGWYLVEAVSLADAEEAMREGNVFVIIEPPDEPRQNDRELRARYKLTPAEVRVAKMLAQGKTNRQIAMDIRASIHTVRHHVEHVFAKLGIHTRGAARVALAEGGPVSAGGTTRTEALPTSESPHRDRAARLTPYCGAESTLLRETSNAEWSSLLGSRKS